MNKKLSKIFITLLSVAVLLSSASASAVTELESEQGSSYQYGYWKNVLSAPVAYTCTDSISLRDMTGTAGSLEDVAVDKDGNCYVADKKNNCVYAINADFSGHKIFKGYNDGGKTYPFKQPEGVFETGGKIYVANTAGKNIVILNTEGETLQVIKAPTKEEMTTTVDYEPVRVSADLAGRLFVLSRNQTQGILKFSTQGEFTGYLGAVRVTPSALDLFYRSIASDEMKKRMLKFVPTEYSSLTTDSDGFVYCIVGTVDSGDIYSAINSRTSATGLPVRKINSLSNDILINSGFFPPVGDIDFSMYGREGGASTFIDVSVNENGIYSLLDSRRNRIFTYDTGGNLLFVFGGKGSGVDQLSHPAAIAYHGNSVYVLDKETETVKRFTPTSYSDKVFKAVQLHLNGKYEEENQLWHQIKMEYAGSDLAYLGIGKNAYINGNYKDAMAYFKMINNKTYYSKALSAATRKNMEQNILWLLPLLITSVIVLVIGLRYSLRLMKKSKNLTVQGVLYGGHIIMHPFDGFWDMRHENRGNIRSATIILTAAYLTDVLYIRFQPYMFQSLNLDETNVFFKGLSDIIIPVIMWVVSNWCFTTLFDGKGTASDIYTATCYSLFPLVVFMPVILVVSQFFTADAQPIYNVMLMLVYVWIGFMLFSSTLTIHQFSFAKTIAMILLTLAGMAIIVFISLLCFNLLAEIAAFIFSLYKELLFHF